jgi:hypothetical protein
MVERTLHLCLRYVTIACRLPLIASHVYKLSRGARFRFSSLQPPPVSTPLPDGVLTVVACWGARFKDGPPSDPWMLLARDQRGRLHNWTLPALTAVELHPIPRDSPPDI